MTKQESENIAKKLQTLQSPDEQIAYLSTVAERYPDERLLRLAFAQKIHEILLSENTSIQESDNPVAVGLENEYRLNATILAAKDAISHSDFKTAETLVDSVLPFAEEIALFYASSKTKRSAYYEDSFEEFVDFFLHRKEGAVQEILYPIGEVYALRGEIEFEMNAYKKAAADFQKAILYAPAHLAFYQEHLKSSLALKKSPEQIKKEIVAMFPFARKASDLRPLYDQLADFKEEEGDYRGAEIYHALGLSFAEGEDEENEEADAVERIAHYTGSPYEELSAEELHSFLTLEQVPMGTNPTFLEALNQLVLMLGKKERDYDEALPLATILVSLSCQEEGTVALLESLKLDQAKAQS